MRNEGISGELYIVSAIARVELHAFSVTIHFLHMTPDWRSVVFFIEEEPMCKCTLYVPVECLIEDGVEYDSCAYGRDSQSIANLNTHSPHNTNLL